jgi:serine/threonine-protein kinase
VAVKLLRPELAGDQRVLFESRFFHEARESATLQHPNVVIVHDYGRTEEGECFLVMEFVEGPTLKDLLRQGPLPRERLLRAFDQIGQGLRHAHGRGLLHRDVKPANILLMRDDEGEDRVKILDFGLVQLLDEETTEVGAGSIMGTPQYMSPEQIRGETLDVRSDLYSLGVMLYAALTGTLPFNAPNTAAILHLHLTEPFPPMANRAPGVEVPSSLEAICHTCMAKDREDRYPDMDAFLTALRDAANRLPGSDSVELQDVVAEPTEADEIPEPSPASEARASPPAPLGHLKPHALFWLLLLALLAVGLCLGFLGVPRLLAFLRGQVGGSPSPEVEISIIEESIQPAVEAPVEPRPPTSMPPSPEIPVTPSQVLPHQAPLQPRAPPPVERRSPAPPKESGPVTLEGVSFSAGEATRVLRFANEADDAAMRAAGVYPQARRSLLEGRPFADLRSLADAPFISTKTLEALKRGGTADPAR